MPSAPCTTHQVEGSGRKGTGALRPLRNSSEGNSSDGNSSEGPVWRPVWHVHANIGRIVFMMPPASRSDYISDIKPRSRAWETMPAQIDGLAAHTLGLNTHPKEPTKIHTLRTPTYASLNAALSAAAKT
jgi:hypothetical protein